MSVTIEGMSPEQVCKAYTGKVHGIALSIFQRLPPGAGLEAEDLIGFGHVGLLEASKRFSPDKGASFSTYADFRIRGAILDALRAEDSVSKWGHRQIRRMSQSQAEAQRLLGRKATHGEIAALMGEDLDRYWTLRGSARRISCSDLHSDTIKGRPIRDIVSSGAIPPDVHLIDQERSRLVGLALSMLSERDQSLLVAYYVDDLSMAEVGGEIGVSDSRVSQILKKARLILWEHLKISGISSVV